MAPFTWFTIQSSKVVLKTTFPDNYETQPKEKKNKKQVANQNNNNIITIIGATKMTERNKT